MIVGHHIVIGAYGFWLPNDPRGSWSDFVGSLALLRHGRATKTTTRRSIARAAHDRAARLAAKQSLSRPAVEFTGVQARAIGRGLADFIGRAGLTAWACAILPDHFHLVLGQCRRDVDQVIIQLKASATRRLLDEGRHPFQNQRTANGLIPKCFVRGKWNVFLDPPDVPRAIRYVEDNPLKDGLPRQKWSFVVPYPGPS